MTDILKFYGTNLTISGFLHSIPLEWYAPAKQSYSNKLLRACQTPEANKALKFKSIISAATLAIILFQAIQNSLCQNCPIENGLLSWMLCFILIPCNFHVNICRIKAPEISAFINGLIQFDKMYPKKVYRFTEMSFQRFACLVTVLGLMASQTAFPFGAIFGFHWVNPWKFSLAGYWLIPKPNHTTDSTLVKGVALGIKMLVLMFNCWMV